MVRRSGLVENDQIDALAVGIESPPRRGRPDDVDFLAKAFVAAA